MEEKCNECNEELKRMLLKDCNKCEVEKNISLVCWKNLFLKNKASAELYAYIKANNVALNNLVKYSELNDYEEYKKYIDIFNKIKWLSFQELKSKDDQYEILSKVLSKLSKESIRS
ncbi:hypothetical protein [Mesoplasma chauliocola]|nr:hypothetical protein [Mesoplasma chauliocola]